MPKSVSVQVAKDHLERLTRATGITAIMELIWNSLDADAKRIIVLTKENPLGIDEITITDDGHGINYTEADIIFGSLGGSAKKTRRLSPGKRKLHGQEGQGRYKGLALGTLMMVETTYEENDVLKSYKVTIDANDIRDTQLTDVKVLPKGTGNTGTKVTLRNVMQTNASVLSTEKFVQQLEEKLAVYYLAYPDFKIIVNNYALDFERQIFRKAEDSFAIPDEQGLGIRFNLRLIEWNISNDKNIYLCDNKGISYLDIKLGVRTSNLNISVYILSDHIEDLHRSGLLSYVENAPLVGPAINKAKDFSRHYVRNRLHENARDFIEDAKREGIYPYHDNPQNEVQEAQRKVFDILALNINEYVPKFSEQETANKKLTLSLVKEALESDSRALRKILTEAISLPKDRQEELAELLEQSSLADITSTVKNISERLQILYELRLLLFDLEVRKHVLERKHLHKIVRSNTWIFEDDYTYGVDDVNLRNVLRAHLQQLGRTDFEATIEGIDNPALADIPDICLFKQFPRGRAGHFENFVIELKRPSKHSGTEELEQVKRYARAISTDPRFDQTRTVWTVVLLVTDMTKDLEFEYNQENKPLGEILVKRNLKIYVKKWIDVLTDAEARHQYIKNMLNHSITEDEAGINLLKAKYSMYLPEQLLTESPAS